MRGRRPAGPDYVDGLEGSQLARHRLKVILQTLKGECRLSEACTELNISPQRFHQLREEALTGALLSIEPGSPGRRPQTPSPDAERIRALEAELAAKEVELKAAWARAEIATILPSVASPTSGVEPKKKNAPDAGTPPAPAAWHEEEHVKRLLQQQDSPAANIPVCHRRGPAKQRPRRERQRRLRHDLVDFARWTDTLGLSLPQTADILMLAPRTLRQWRLDLTNAARPILPLGRPTLRSPYADRNDVLAIIDDLGPRVGVAELKACCPHMSRAELTDLLLRYRRVWRARRMQLLHVLDWRVPGAAWAMDFAQPPLPIDGLYPYLLAVRDLASGHQLLWRPLKNASAYETILALLPLFMLHGAPLVLKADNGSPFIADDTLDFLAQWLVMPLFSPPRVPQYNGSIEAAVGSMKSRTEEHATRHGRPTQWTWHDTEAARAQANATARPRGLNQPTPDQSWHARPSLTAAQRRAFADAVEVQRLRARFDGGWPVEGPLPVKDARALDRQAIPRALVEHGFLLYSRRRIPLPFPQRKTANIT